MYQETIFFLSNLSVETATNSAPTATPGTGATAPGTPFATPFGPGGAFFVTPLPSCFVPENFTSSGDFEDYLQQFNTAALLSRWFSPSHDNRPLYFALRLQGNALHLYTTLSAAQQTDFNLLVDAFQQNYTTNVDILKLKARLKAARQQPNQDISAFLCDIRTLARRAYRTFPHLVEEIVLTSFIEGLSDATLRWELRKSKPATADDALALAMELNSFREFEKGAPLTSKMAETDPFCKNGLKADPSKIAAVKKFPIPTNPTEVKFFLGLCSCYRRYVQNLKNVRLLTGSHEMTFLPGSFSCLSSFIRGQKRQVFQNFARNDGNKNINQAKI